MKTIAAVLLVGALGVAGWCAAHRSVAPTRASARKVGTHPGGIREGAALAAYESSPTSALVGFSSGCFWGAEEAYRKMPGVIATAVGYTGGTKAFPSYGQAHQSGHLETVLVEFNPQRVPLSELLKVFWTLPRSTIDASKSHSPHGAAIWTYGAQELREAEASRTEIQRKLGYRVRVDIRPAQIFYLAEEFHQQYDEKAGKELCPAEP